jgi:hypothetical protein
MPAHRKRSCGRWAGGQAVGREFCEWGFCSRTFSNSYYLEDSISVWIIKEEENNGKRVVSSALETYKKGN